MRVLRRLGLALAFAMSAAVPALADNLPPLPFPVERGSALPPPAASSDQAAPPEGPGAGGFDFGAWRSANPIAYGADFRARVRERAVGQNSSALRADLEANGFVCGEARGRLDCRIEIVERQCAYDWYVVGAGADAVAGFDKLCR